MANLDGGGPGDRQQLSRSWRAGYHLGGCQLCARPVCRQRLVNQIWRWRMEPLRPVLPRCRRIEPRRVGGDGFAGARTGNEYSGRCTGCSANLEEVIFLARDREPSRLDYRVIRGTGKSLRHRPLG